MPDVVRAQISDRLAVIPTQTGIALLCGLVLTFLGPYYTSGVSLAFRLVYWVGLSLAWVVISLFLERLMTNIGAVQRLARRQRLTLIVGLGAFPMTALVADATERLTRVHFAIEDLPLLYIRVALIVAGITTAIATFTKLLEHGTARQRQPEPTHSLIARGAHGQDAPASVMPSSIKLLHNADNKPSQTLPPGQRLLDRLSPAQRGRIRCLSGEDHYVRIYTSHGASLVLMRFRDAIEELDDLPGQRVHRSWWVAASEPSVFSRKGRNANLQLPGGLTVPVSTPYLEAAKALAAA